MSDKEKDINIERGAVFTENSATGELDAYSCEGGRKLSTYDWETPLTGGVSRGDIFEVRFKNTRKGYYQNVNGLALKMGDIVAVESNPGHDIGIISLSGDMVRKQMRCKGFDPKGTEFRKIYRIAKGSDIVKWQEAIALEHTTMIKARRYAESLGLNMKIGDVEYQGDKVKAIFYYIADARVDFRELIRVFADEFKVRIEMKQIGARQEAGRIGGIGSCGRELCCSTWVTNFVSVTTNSARFQEISLNPLKLAGQCGKLKCCLNYEVDTYIDARKGFPKIYSPLETKDATYHLVKNDILRGEMLFSSDPHSMVNVHSIPIDRVREIIHLNKKGIKVDRLKIEEVEIADNKPDYMNVIGGDSLTRFDKSEESGGKRRNKKNRNNKQQNKTNDNHTEGDSVEISPENKVAPNTKLEPVNNEPNSVGNGNNANGNSNAGGNNNRKNNRERRENRPPRENNRASENNKSSDGNKPNEASKGAENGRQTEQHNTPSNSKATENRVTALVDAVKGVKESNEVSVDGQPTENNRPRNNNRRKFNRHKKSGSNGNSGTNNGSGSDDGNKNGGDTPK